MSNPPVSVIKTDCPCPKRNCKLHGLCYECRAKHARKGQLPRCERSGRGGAGTGTGVYFCVFSWVSLSLSSTIFFTCASNSGYRPRSASKSALESLYTSQ